MSEDKRYKLKESNLNIVCVYYLIQKNAGKQRTT